MNTEVENNVHNVVCYGETLWDILPCGPRVGGAPMNVAYHLKKLGQNPALITRVGLDDLGKKLITMLGCAGLNTDFFQVDYEYPTGTVIATPNENNDVMYNIKYPVAWDYISIEEVFIEQTKRAQFFIYGSLISRNYVSRTTLFQLLEVANTKVLDINLRPPFYTRETVELLLQHADILKLNLEELELITGWFTPFKSIEDRMNVLQDSFDISTVVVTMGNQGAILNVDGKIYRHAGYKVPVMDTVGSGDSFLAALLSNQISKSSGQEMLDCASAMGAFIVTQSGACPEYELENFYNFKKKYQVSENSITNF